MWCVNRVSIALVYYLALTHSVGDYVITISFLEPLRSDGGLGYVSLSKKENCQNSFVSFLVDCKVTERKIRFVHNLFNRTFLFFRVIGFLFKLLWNIQIRNFSQFVQSHISNNSFWSRHPSTSQLDASWCR